MPVAQMNRLNCGYCANVVGRSRVTLSIFKGQSTITRRFCNRDCLEKWLDHGNYPANDTTW